MTTLMFEKGLNNEPGTHDISLIDPRVIKEHMEDISEHVYRSCVEHNYKCDKWLLIEMVKGYKENYRSCKAATLDVIWRMANQEDGITLDSTTISGAAKIISVTKAIVQRIKRDNIGYMIFCRNNDDAYCVHVNVHRNYDRRHEERNWLTFVWLLDKRNDVVYVQVCREDRFRRL